MDPDPDPYPDPYWPPSGSTGSGSVKNEYGSETLRVAGTRPPAAAGPTSLQRRECGTVKNPSHDIYLLVLEQRGLALQFQLGHLVYNGKAGQVRTLGKIPIFLLGLVHLGLALQLQMGRLVYSGQAGQVRTLGTIFTCRY